MNLITTLGKENNNPSRREELVLFDTSKRNPIFLVYLDGKTQDKVLSNVSFLEVENSSPDLSKFHF